MLHATGLGFVEFVPLAIGAVDLVWVIIALAGWIMLAAGWSIYSPIFDILNKVSIFGVRPFAFINSLLFDSMQKLAAIFLKRLSPVGHFFWALGQTIWRPLYVIVDTLQYVVSTINGVNQQISRQVSQLKAQEQADVARLAAQEAASVRALENRMAALQSSLTNLISTDIHAVQAQEQASVTALENRMAALQSSLTATINADIAGVNRTISNDITAVNRTIATDIAGVDATIRTDVSSLTSNINAVRSSIPAVALGVVTSQAPTIVARAVAQVQPEVNAIKTELTECLDPLCADVTPNAPRLGRNLNWLKNLEALGFEAALFALAAECLTNPGAVVADVSAVVHEVGDVVVDGGKTLIGL